MGEELAACPPTCGSAGLGEEVDRQAVSSDKGLAPAFACAEASEVVKVK